MKRKTDIDEEKDNSKMKYFFIGFVICNNNLAVHGNITITYEGYPTRKQLHKHVFDKISSEENDTKVLKVLTVLSYSEMNKEAYDNYRNYDDEDEEEEEMGEHNKRLKQKI